MRFLTGGYTADMHGVASGIGMLQAGSAHDVLAGGPLGYAGVVAVGDSPSWLAWHPARDVVYAAQEGAGTVQAYARTGDDTFQPWGDAVAAGELVCHVAAAPDGRSLIASCWGDGRVVWMPVDATGRLGAPVVADPAVDPQGDAFAAFAVPSADAVPAAQSRASRAHQALFVSADVVLTTDMGFDVVRVWRCAPSGLRFLQQVMLPRGVGPRHMLHHPSGYVYVVTESSQELFVLGADRAGVWRVVGGTPLSPAALHDDAAAEVTASRDAHVVYVGVRGSNAVATLRVRGDGETVEPVAFVDAGVDWPRHHAVVRDTLLVAGQRSDDVVSLTLDDRTGVPGRVRHRTAVPSPTCLLPLR